MMTNEEVILNIGPSTMKKLRLFAVLSKTNPTSIDSLMDVLSKQFDTMLDNEIKRMLTVEYGLSYNDSKSGQVPVESVPHGENIYSPTQSYEHDLSSDEADENTLSLEEQYQNEMEQKQSPQVSSEDTVFKVPERRFPKIDSEDGFNLEVVTPPKESMPKQRVRSAKKAFDPRFGAKVTAFTGDDGPESTDELPFVVP